MSGIVRSLATHRPTVLVSTYTDPYVNLTLGTYLTKKVNETASKVLLLCSSHQGVFIGKNQNCWVECNIKKMKKDNIPLIRRDTGGGTCFVDQGNRLFSFIEPNCDQPHKRNLSVVVNALNQLNLNGHKAVIEGRNDICINGMKVSGSAFTVMDRVARHHGTLLLNVNKEKVDIYTTPSKIKLKSKGVKSAAARIGNLTDFNPAITYPDVDRALISSFLADCGTSSDLVVLDKDNFNNIIDDPVLFDKILTKYKSKEYIYNENPPFSLKLDHKFSFGIVQIYLECNDNKIVKSEIYSDSLDLKLIESLREVFVGKYYNIDLPIKMFHNLNSALGDDYQKVIEEFCEHFQTLFRDEIDRFMGKGFMSIG